MEIDMSSKELKAASTAMSVAIEVAKNRLGEGEISPELMLACFTGEQLDEFIRVCGELETDFDHLIPSPEVERGEAIIEEGGYNYPPYVRREVREMRGRLPWRVRSSAIRKKSRARSPLTDWSLL